MKPCLSLFTLCLFLAVPPTPVGAAAKDFTDSFDVDKRELSPTGRNRFFILEPGFVLRLEGKEYKLYAPGIGLIQDGLLKLTQHGRPVP